MTGPEVSLGGATLDHVTTTQTGHVPSQAEVLGAVRELRAAGQNTISPMQALEHLSSGYTEASKTVDFDLVFPTVVHIFEQAGRRNARWLLIDLVDAGPLRRARFVRKQNRIADRKLAAVAILLRLA